MKRLARMLRLTAVSFAITLTATHANAVPTGGKAYFFGDSLTDCCVFGRTTNNNLPNWADLLPSLIGESYTASAQTNFAARGAESGVYNIAPFLDNQYGQPTGLLSQVSRFNQQRGAISSSDIAAIWIGTNDIAAATFPVSSSLPLNQPLGSFPAVAALTGNIIGNIQTSMASLAADGFRNFVVLSPYDLGVSTGILPGSLAAATTYATALRDAERYLYVPGAMTYSVDLESLLRTVQANPGAYGFTHYLAADNCVAASCESASSAVQDSYLFYDGIHFTTAFHRLIAADAAEIINAGQLNPVPEPTSVALLLSGLGAIGLSAGRKRQKSS